VKRKSCYLVLTLFYTLFFIGKVQANEDGLCIFKNGGKWYEVSWAIVTNQEDWKIIFYHRLSAGSSKEVILADHSPSADTHVPAKYAVPYNISKTRIVNDILVHAEGSYANSNWSISKKPTAVGKSPEWDLLISVPELTFMVTTKDCSVTYYNGSGGSRSEGANIIELNAKMCHELSGNDSCSVS
jgi:hypothetical protein